MALTNPCFTDQIGLICERRTRREERRGEEEKEEKRKKGDSSQDQAKKVWKLTLIRNPMRFGMDLWLCRIIIFPKLGVLLGFYLNPKLWKVRWEKPHMAQDGYGILPLRMDSWCNC